MARLVGSVRSWGHGQVERFRAAKRSSSRTGLPKWCHGRMSPSRHELCCRASLPLGSAICLTPFVLHTRSTPTLQTLLSPFVCTLSYIDSKLLLSSIERRETNSGRRLVLSHHFIVYILIASQKLDGACSILLCFSYTRRWSTALRRLRYSPYRYDRRKSGSRDLFAAVACSGHAYGLFLSCFLLHRTS